MEVLLMVITYQLRHPNSS